MTLVQHVIGFLAAMLTLGMGVITLICIAWIVNRRS